MRRADRHGARGAHARLQTIHPVLSPVVWTSIVNATASGNTLTKTGGCDGCGDAGGASQQTIASGDGAVEFSVPAGSFLMAGLSVGNTTTDGSEIDFALRFYPSGAIEVRENGVYKWETRYHGGERFRVAIEAGQVKYSMDGDVFYSHAVTPAYPLLVDSVLGSNALITSAVIMDAP